jgi:hypothetical protein
MIREMMSPDLESRHENEEASNHERVQSPDGLRYNETI